MLEQRGRRGSRRLEFSPSVEMLCGVPTCLGNRESSKENPAETPGEMDCGGVGGWLLGGLWRRVVGESGSQEGRPLWIDYL